MNYLKIIIGWGGTLIFALVAAYVVTWFPACRRVTVPPGQQAIKALLPNANVGLDGTATINSFEPGNIVCYKLGEKEIQRASFGYVAGCPGDTIEIVEMMILVNGQEIPQAKSASKLQGYVGNRAPMVVPEGHLYVVTDRHRKDSIALGPIPMAAVRGRVRSWAQ